MIRIDQNDDLDFIEIVANILNHSIQTYDPADIWLVKLDHWFGPSWRGFSNKFLGEVGIGYYHKLRIPPFVPERVESESFFHFMEGEVIPVNSSPLHRRQRSEDNRYRLISNLTKKGILVWYSGATKLNTSASIMVYSICGESQNSWFISFSKKEVWEILQTNNLSLNEVRSMVDGHIRGPFYTNSSEIALS